MTATNPFFRAAPVLDLRLAPDDIAEGRIEGYGSVFGVADMHGDLVKAGAFVKSLAERMPAMLWAHDQTRPIGRWAEAAEDQRGLFLKGRLNLETADGQMAHAHLRAGDVTGLSMGFLTPPGGAAIAANGLRLLSAVDLFEVSPVAIPSNQSARITSVKSIGHLGSERELRSALHAAGLSQGAAKKIAAAGWPALNGDEDQPNLKHLALRIRAATAELSTKG